MVISLHRSILLFRGEQKKKNHFKLLGTPFGLNLDVVDVDKFLLNKHKKKNSYWFTTKISLASRMVVVNNVFLSFHWYLLIVWARF
jgi:hypothetical protein